MNRQLKFKIFDKNDTNHIVGPFDWNKLPQFLFPDNFIVLQFTSLKDKNGNDIYEGDIVLNEADHRTPTMCVVGWSVYEDIGFALYYPFKEPMEPLRQNFNGIDLYEGLPMCYGRGYGYEIIGNIFENPELLK